jgi:hypothetical protein
MVEVAIKLGFIKDLGDYQDLPMSRFGESFGDGSSSSQELLETT